MSVVVSLQSKVCSQCREVKLLEEFYKSINGYLRCSCMDCSDEVYLKTTINMIKRENSVINKLCQQCQSTKHKTEFHRSSFSKDGYDSKCKTCKKSNRSYLIDETEQYQQTPVVSCQQAKDRLSRRTEKGCVYVFRDFNNKALKVGFTTDLKQRTKNHLSSNPFLVLIDVIDYVGIQIEYQIHSRLTSHRLPDTKEWYEDNIYVLSILADYKLKYRIKEELFCQSTVD